MKNTYTVTHISKSSVPQSRKRCQRGLKAKRQKAKSYHDQGSKSLPELEIGQEFIVAGQQNRI